MPRPRPTSRHALLVLTATSLIATVLAACAPTRTPTPSPTAAPRPLPPDFALELTLKATPAPDPDLEPAWYVLDPDGTLRAALGERSATSPLPPVIRRLTDEQAAAVWDAVRAVGYDALPPPGLNAGDPTHDLADAAPRAIVTLAADRQRRAFIVAADTDADHLRALVRPLRALAWIRPPADR